MKRLLCIVGSMNPGGAETFLMKIYRTIDKQHYQMDFCVSIDSQGAYDNEIKSLGGRIIHTVPKSRGAIKAFRSIMKIVKENHYDYVLRVSQHSLSGLELIAAKLGGAQKVAFRSSNTQTGGGRLNRFLHVLFMPITMLVPDVKIAPSTEAAEFMFGKKCIQKGTAVIVPNGLDIEQYRYNADEREKLRRSMRIEDNFVVGHVGRLTRQKNHRFLINVFSEIHKIKPNAVLVLVGKGELEEEIREQVYSLHLDNCVKMLGLREDIPELMSSFDTFVFPSFFEGMPNTVLEAQTSGLPCVISNTITSEARVTDRVVMASLNDSCRDWAELVIDHYELHKNNRDSAAEEMCDRGYDIQSCSDLFVKLLLS